MRIYKMQQPIQYYKPSCRKDGEILPVGSKVPYFVWFLLLFATSIFANAFVTDMTLNSYLFLFEDFMDLIDYDRFAMLMLFFVGLFEVGLFYLQVMIYNFIARWYLRGNAPCETKELYRSLIPFWVLKNVIVGGLSLLMFMPGGMFVSIGLTMFDNIATMIIFIPAFNAIKKRYIKQGYGKDILLAYAVPYIILQVAFLIF